MLGRPVDVLAESYVHMFMNRLFGSEQNLHELCLLYTSDAADERSSVDLGGRRIIKKKKKRQMRWYGST